ARYQMPSPEGASGAGLPQTGAPRTDKTRISSRISGRSILVEIDGSAIGLLASPLQYFLPLLRVHFLGLGHRPPQGAFQVHLLPLVLIAPEQKSPVKFARWLSETQRIPDQPENLPLGMERRISVRRALPAWVAHPVARPQGRPFVFAEEPRNPALQLQTASVLEFRARVQVGRRLLVMDIEGLSHHAEAEPIPAFPPAENRSQPARNLAGERLRFHLQEEIRVIGLELQAQSQRNHGKILFRNSQDAFGGLFPPPVILVYR